MSHVSYALQLHLLPAICTQHKLCAMQASMGSLASQQNGQTLMAGPDYYPDYYGRS
jgi:hypothetical protein